MNYKAFLQQIVRNFGCKRGVNSIDIPAVMDYWDFTEMEILC